MISDCTLDALTKSVTTLQLTQEAEANKNELHICQNTGPYNPKLHFDILPSITHLKIDIPIFSEEFDRLARNAWELKVVSVVLDMTDDLCFSCVATCHDLYDLTIRAQTTRGNSQIRSFDIAMSHPPLRRLTILNAKICRWFIEGLVRIPKVEHLSLENCEFDAIPQLQSITILDNLQVLNLTNVRTALENQVQGFVHHLLRQGAKIKIFPENTVIDRTSYQNVLTRNHAPGCYSLSELQNTEALKPELRQLLRTAGKNEDSYWQPDRESTICHAYNKCPLNGANPIKCPDNRVRIAAAEPKYNNQDEFWRHVLEYNVSVIVMVKETGFYYFPQKVGQQKKLASAVVTCKEATCNKELQITHRILTVNQKTVHHIQINWEDGKGMEQKKLLSLLEQVAELEKTPGQTLVHCLAGCGRTGTFFACLILDQLLKTKEKTEHLYLNPEELLRGLRQQRRKVISTTDQLHCVVDFFKTKATPL